MIHPGTLYNVRVLLHQRKRVFVTGASGAIGKELVRKLLLNSCYVVALVRDKSKLNIDNINLKIIEADISEIEKYKEDLRKCDYVFHLAVYQNPLDKEFDEYFRVNVDGTEKILKLLIGSKINKFIYVSTIMVFKSTNKMARSEKWLKRQLGGKNHYVDSKLQALEIVNKYRSLIPTITLYPSIVINKSDILNGDNGVSRGWIAFVRNVFGGGLPGALMCMIGDKKRVVNYIFMNNLINAMYGVIDKGKVGEDYILGGENISAEKYLCEATKSKSGKHIPFRIPWWVIKSLAAIKISPFKIIEFIVNNPPEDMCFSSRKAVNTLGLKIGKMEDIKRST